MSEKTFYRHKISDLVNVKKIVTIHYQELHAGYASEEEKHDFWELIYADRRSVAVIFDGEEIQLEQGEAFFVTPNAPHFVRCNEDANIFIISFECRSEGIEMLAGRTVDVPKERRALLQTVMTEALQTFRIPDFDPALNRLELLPEPNLGGEQALKNSLELFLIYLLRQENERAPRYFVSKIENSDELQDEIVRCLSEHLYEAYSLDALARELHYGKTHLCTFFREKTGTSIYKTYLKLKIDEAKKLIRKGVPLAEIADKLGFSSLPHFIATFKRYAGRTPREYAASIRK